MAPPRQQRRRKQTAPIPSAQTVLNLEGTDADGLSTTHMFNRVLLGAHMLALTMVVLAMTPLTNNLDDIKVPIFFITGPILLILALWTIGLGRVPIPPRIITLPLACYAAVLCLSTFTSDFSWAGYYQMVLVGSAIGYFLSACCIASLRPTSRVFLQYFVVLLLVTNLIGLFCFDLTTGSDHHSGVAALINWLYGQQPPSRAGWVYLLLNTLKHADRSMLSTILNRDFYAAFCSLYLPFGLFLALTPPGKSDQGLMARRGLGLLTSLLSIVCIFYCQSKGEWIFTTVSCTFLAVMYFLFVPIKDLDRTHLFSWIGGVMLFLLILGWMKSPTLFSQLKSLGYSINSRSIIWSGSYDIFKAHPLFGSGPGTFRIYFPEFRSPDYYLHEISNLTLYSHNYFLDLLAETGLLGFTAFGLMLGGLFFGAFFKVPSLRDNELKAMLIATMAALIAIFGSNLSSPNGRWIIGASSLWTVMGWMAGLITQARIAGLKTTEEGPSTSVEDLEDSHNQKWKMPVGTILILSTLGLVFWGYASWRGINDFRSAMYHRNGLGYMDQGYTRLDNGIDTLDNAQKYLEHSALFFEKAHTFDPTNLSSYYKQGSVYTTLFQIEQSLAVQSQRAGKTAQMNQHMAKAAEYLAKGRASYETLAGLAPDYAEIHYNLGIVYQEMARNLNAQYKQLMANPLKAPEAALVQEEAEEFQEKALNHLERMGQLSNKADVAVLRGDQYAKNGYREKARDVFRDASRLYPKNEDLARQYLMSAQSARDPKGMMEALRTLWSLHPGDDTLLDQMIALGSQAALHEELSAIATRLEAINPINPRLSKIREILSKKNPPIGEGS